VKRTACQTAVGPSRVPCEVEEVRHVASASISGWLVRNCASTTTASPTRLVQGGVRLNLDPGDAASNQQFLAPGGFQRELLAPTLLARNCLPCQNLRRL
jgi:hypothetical protein